MDRASDLFTQIVEKGEAAIDELIAARQAEELFLDFKRSADSGAGRRLHDNDNKNFGKAISGFGNAEGGVVVWGVDCSKAKDGPDVASMKIPLTDAAGFASRLEGAISRCTVPAHSGVRNVPITRSQGLEGFVVSLIPKSNAAPHQMVPGLQYYMRAGSDFVPVPHAILAGMFGRRPEPTLRIRRILPYAAELTEKEITFDVGLAVHNRGPGIARDIFLTLLGLSIPCAVGSLAFQHGDSKIWTGTKFLGVHMSYLSNHNIRLAPDSYLMPCSLLFKISPPFTSDLHIKGTVGCEGGMPHSFSFENTRERVEAAYKTVHNAQFLEMPQEENLRRFPMQLLGIESEENVNFYIET